MNDTAGDGGGVISKPKASEAGGSMECTPGEGPLIALSRFVATSSILPLMYIIVATVTKATAPEPAARAMPTSFGGEGRLKEGSATPMSFGSDGRLNAAGTRKPLFASATPSSLVGEGRRNEDNEGSLIPLASEASSESLDSVGTSSGAEAAGEMDIVGEGVDAISSCDAASGDASLLAVADTSPSTVALGGLCVKAARG